MTSKESGKITEVKKKAQIVLKVIDLKQKMKVKNSPLLEGNSSLDL